MGQLYVSAEAVKIVFNGVVDSMAEELGGHVNIGPEGYKYILDAVLEKLESVTIERVEK